MGMTTKEKFILEMASEGNVEFSGSFVWAKQTSTAPEPRSWALTLVHPRGEIDLYWHCMNSMIRSRDPLTRNEEIRIHYGAVVYRLIGRNLKAMSGRLRSASLLQIHIFPPVLGEKDIWTDEPVVHAIETMSSDEDMQPMQPPGLPVSIWPLRSAE